MAARFKLTSIVPRESEVQTSIIDAIERLRIGKVIRYNSGGMYDKRGRFVRFHSAPGHSDLAGCLFNGGRAFYLEVKRPGESATEDQQRFLDAMASTGAIAATVHSVVEALAALGWNGGVVA